MSSEQGPGEEAARSRSVTRFRYSATIQEPAGASSSARRSWARGSSLRWSHPGRPWAYWARRIAEGLVVTFDCCEACPKFSAETLLVAGQAISPAMVRYQRCVTAGHMSLGSLSGDMPHGPPSGELARSISARYSTRSALFSSVDKRSSLRIASSTRGDWVPPSAASSSSRSPNCAYRAAGFIPKALARERITSGEGRYSPRSIWLRYESEMPLRRPSWRCEMLANCLCARTNAPNAWANSSWPSFTSPMVASPSCRPRIAAWDTKHVRGRLGIPLKPAERIK